MDFHLDIGTILLTLVIGNIATALLVATYRFRVPVHRTLSSFALSKWLQSACWLLVLMRGVWPFSTLVLLGNALFLVGGSLEIIALLILAEVLDGWSRRYFIVIASAGILAYGLVYFGHGSEDLRIAAASLTASFFLFWAAIRLLLSRKNSSLLSLMGLGYIVIASAIMVRGLTALFTDKAMNVFSDGLVQHAYYLGMFLFMIIGSAGFVLLLREKAYERLQRMAAYDELTGVLNRRAFRQQAEEAVRNAAVRKEPVSFLLLDIDHFKRLNDSYGHLVGDEALQSFTVSVGNCLNPRDLFGRFGGEEFAVLLKGADEAASEETSERIRKAVMNSRLEGHSLQYTVSIGVVTIVPQRQTRLDQLYKLGDAALYRAKHGGRNQVVRGSAAT
ncbi:GGDEF domain-containing protein [Paenibacillus sp. HN-1]|uniref:GGDEF domain-containing protein n=1 Tax=Paenibacillus TaxID=44249 RepID=UPI001CA7E2C0|nr:MULTISPECIES: GGDEF domain-containing protein [Paenibacillus]MBY9079395.1 GGDEF domain-containing protein [Paenibacillus sp. CGMCC 1.18879]MBY9085690.1 GGDEF domain-containing protein [Paenibacillus sinensis]